MKKKTSRELFGVIGLGRFGFALAETLAKSGKEVLVVDKYEQKIKDASLFTDNAFTVDTLCKESLQEVGIQNCDTVIVCVGEKIDTSILTTLTVIRLGVNKVIAKAISAEHGTILELMGAQVVYPERDMAVRLAKRLITPMILEQISLDDEIDIVEFILAKESTVAGLNLRRQYSLNIIAVKKGNTITTEITPDMKLGENDILIIIGKKVNLHKFEQEYEEEFNI